MKPSRRIWIACLIGMILTSSMWLTIEQVQRIVSCHLRLLEQDDELSSSQANLGASNECASFLISRARNPFVSSPKASADIIVQLSGGMGNHLSKMVHGIALQSWLQDDDAVISSTAISSRLILRHQDSRKWKESRRAVQQCFPFTRQLDFEEGNSERVNAVLAQHHHILDGPEEGINAGDAMQVETALSAFRVRFARNETENVLQAQRLVFYDIFVDRFYDRLRQLLKFDFEACASDEQPYPDETVFVSLVNVRF